MDRKSLNKNRRAIIKFINKNPGTHFSGIMKRLKMTKRGLGYHLERLVKEKIVVSVPHGIYRFYYPPGTEIPRHFTPKQQVILDIIGKQPCSQAEIAGTLRNNLYAVGYHIGNLVKMGAITKDKDGLWRLK